MDFYNEINFQKLVTSLMVQNPDVANQFVASEAPSGHSDSLAPISKINLFVGPNNCGKSRFLRALFLSIGTPNIYFNTTQHSLRELQEIVLTGYSTLEKNFSARERKYEKNKFDSVAGAFNKVLSSGHNGTYTYSGANVFQIFQDELTALMRDDRASTHLATVFFNNTHRQFRNIFMDAFIQVQKSYEAWSKEKTLKTVADVPLKSVFIPSRRSLRRSFSQPDHDMETVMTDLFSKSKVTGWQAGKLSDKHKVVNGHDIHKKITDQLLDSHQSRATVHKYEKFLKNSFFEGQSITLSPKLDSVLNIKVGERPDFPIHDLGDGIQAVILLTYDAFFSEDRHCYFVDEPELAMHPGLQRKFLEEISKDPQLNRHQWFFTTHSNHFLDLAAMSKDIAIFKFASIGDKFSVTTMAAGRNELLSCLGVQASSVFRTNAILWVEGITDRKYLNYFLKKKDIEGHFKEDVHYTFVELGGGNMVHFNFSNKEDKSGFINTNALAYSSFAIIDGDNRDKIERFRELQLQLGDRLVVLSCKEIENILPESAIQKVVTRFIMDSTTEEIKNNKEAILERVTSIRFEHYSQVQVGVGKYLDQVLGIEALGTKYFSSTESGTISTSKKVRFCEEVIKTLTLDHQTTPIIDEVIQGIEVFIRRSNP